MAFGVSSREGIMLAAGLAIGDAIGELVGPGRKAYNWGQEKLQNTRFGAADRATKLTVDVLELQKEEYEYQKAQRGQLDRL